MTGQRKRARSRPDAMTTGTHPVVRDTAKTGHAPLVLLVDDHEDSRVMYTDQLEWAGMRVSHAVDGEHALWKVITAKPDVVVMDLAMPTLDGWEATRAIKTNPKTRHVPVIALTGHVMPAELRRAAEAGADVVLTKPCTPRELLSVVDRWLTR